VTACSSHTPWIDGPKSELEHFKASRTIPLRSVGRAHTAILHTLTETATRQDALDRLLSLPERDTHAALSSNPPKTLQPEIHHNHGSSAGERGDGQQRAQVRGRRLQQRCRQPSVSDMPKARKGVLLLRPGLLQAQLGRSVKCSRTKRRAPRETERAWPSLLEHHLQGWAILFIRVYHRLTAHTVDA
jgi:hypothetical protein